MDSRFYFRYKKKHYYNRNRLAGWYALKAGVAPTTYLAGTGSASTETLYSFGATSDSDRALGCVFANSGSGTFTFGANFKNVDATKYITGLTVTYHGEQWRRGVS
jgi:spore germination protein YaaH